MRVRTLFLASLGVAGLALLACGSGDFDPSSVVDSVRMFGVRTDKPYAKPGETVTFTTLSTDARRDRPRPLQVYWLPVLCVNPTEDLYYLCFGGTGGSANGTATLVSPYGSDAGATTVSSGSGTTALDAVPRNTDLSALLPKGDSFTVQLPADMVVERPGTTAYGLGIVFNIACAGQVRLGDRTGDNPQQLPLLCTDENGTPLGADDYVIGINRVYAYRELTNTNPVIDAVTLDGGVVDVDAGITLPVCTTRKLDDCPPVAIDVSVPETSWELNPASSSTVHEQIWVDYYSNVGKLKNDARLLYDTRSGRVSGSRVEYRAPKGAADGTIWAVVHDNRTGAAFVTVPLHVR